MYWKMMSGGVATIAAASLGYVALARETPNAATVATSPATAVLWPAEIAACAIVAIAGATLVVTGIARSIPRLSTWIGGVVACAGLLLAGHGVSRILRDAVDAVTATTPSGTASVSGTAELFSGIALAFVGSILFSVSIARLIRASTGTV